MPYSNRPPRIGAGRIGTRCTGFVVRFLMLVARVGKGPSVNKDQFHARTFVLPKHCPDTGLGYFDAHYNPSTQLLRIDVRYEILFVNASLTWTEEIKNSFKSDFSGRIPEFWNNRFAIHCTKPGWTDVVAIPEFTLREADDRHFAIKAAGTFGTSNTAVRPFGRGHTADAGPIDHATAIFGSQAADRWANADFQLEQIKNALRKSFVVPYGSGDQGGPLSALALGHLQSFASNVVHAFARTAAKPKLKLTSLNSWSTQAADLAKSFLQLYGVQNVIETSRDSIVAWNKTGVKVEWASMAEFDSMFPTDTRSVPLFSQAAVVHEYGHMLGLPDEYNVLCSESLNPLVAHKLVRETTEGERFLDYNLNQGAADTPVTTKCQRVFIDLCGQAKLVPPPFGRPNMNIMSGGSRFEPHHCVTVWAALGNMTQGVIDRNQWDIRMVE